MILAASRRAGVSVGRRRGGRSPEGRGSWTSSPDLPKIRIFPFCDVLSCSNMVGFGHPEAHDKTQICQIPTPCCFKQELVKF